VTKYHHRVCGDGRERAWGQTRVRLKERDEDVVGNNPLPPTHTHTPPTLLYTLSVPLIGGGFCQDAWGPCYQTNTDTTSVFALFKAPSGHHSNLVSFIQTLTVTRLLLSDPFY